MQSTQKGDLVCYFFWGGGKVTLESCHPGTAPDLSLLGVFANPAFELTPTLAGLLGASFPGGGGGVAMSEKNKSLRKKPKKKVTQIGVFQSMLPKLLPMLHVWVQMKEPACVCTQKTICQSWPYGLSPTLEVTQKSTIRLGWHLPTHSVWTITF